MRAAPHRDEAPPAVDTEIGQALARLTLLADVTTAITSTFDQQQALSRLARLLVPQLGDWCVIDVLDEYETLNRTAIVHRDPAAVPSGGEGVPVAVDAQEGPLARVLRGARPLLLSRREISPRDGGTEMLPELFARLDADTAIIAPLRARGQVVGALTLGRADPDHPLTAEDLPLVEDLARRTALAADNARLYSAVQHTAERLQRSLLPELPEPPDYRWDARYLPARRTAEVGGDWYDAFVMPDGDCYLVIGDVTGHDLSAAVTMSRLRNMLRALACDRRDDPPGTILQRLDAVNMSLYGPTNFDAPVTATVLFGKITRLERGRWRWHFSNAGHLPPLVITGEGETAFLDGGHGPLLGLLPDTPRPDATAELPAGSTLLLYTDGLIERPGEPLDHGLTRLRQHAAGLIREPLDVFCDKLLMALAADNTHDDTALIVVRFPPEATSVGAGVAGPPPVAGL